MNDPDTEALAALALQAAISNQPLIAARCLEQLDQRGPYGIGFAMQVWIDTFVDHATAGDPELRPSASVHMFNTATGEVSVATDEDISGVSTMARWGARAMLARARGDHAAFQALLDELPRDDPARLGAYIMTLLFLCGDSINDTPRGFAKLSARMRAMPS